jgi:hypothetical protein
MSVVSAGYVEQALTFQILELIVVYGPQKRCHCHGKQ